MCFLFFFFFKQKTAYEIKECDWSSDVCSSDLVAAGTLSGTFQLRHLPEGALILKVRAHGNRVDSIAFSPRSDGLLATASNDGTAHLWKWTERGVEKLMSDRKSVV